MNSNQIKMAIVQHCIVVILILQLCVNAAPSDISKLEDIAKIEEADVNRKDKSYSLLDDDNNNKKTTTQGQRQKRFYDYYGYGFPPINPIIYPSHVKRDELETGVYGLEDPFTHIYRKLQEIKSVVRHPATQPPPLPIFFPVIYIPLVGCGCTPGVNTTPVNPPVNNETSPDLFNRFPEMEDPRQNWGFVVNETESNEDDEEDIGRPISFDPIRPNRTMNRPPPPVEHGSSQSDSTSQNQDQTTTTSTGRPRQDSPSAGSVFDSTPTVCDGAVLSCCHQPEVTYNCFTSQGCPDPTSYGNPCDPNVILQVIDRFQKFYGQRT